MKDKIFMTFLCVAVFGVTNAMGDVGDGPGSCKVQAEVRPGDAERYGEGADDSVWLKGDLLFISDNEALRCGGDFCGEGVEIDNFGKVFRCTVTGGIGEWQKVELGVDIPFCDDSEIKELDVKNADYSTSPIGEDDENVLVGHNYIDTKGFCVDAECLFNHRYIDGKCVHTECKQLIDSGKATGWDDENDACLCNDTANAEWRDYNCVCKDTVNAEMGDDGKCVCKDTNAKMGDDGKCVCKDEGMEFDEDGNCVKKAAESNAKANAMGAVGDGPGSCKVQAEVRPGDAERYGEGDDTSVWLKGDLFFISDNEALRCGGGFCDDGVGIDNFGKVFRCTVTGGIGEWQKVELGVDIPFCDDSEIKVLDVKRADYSASPIGEGDENVFVGHNYIDIKGFCVDAECILDHRYIDGKCVHTECKHLIDSGKATGWDDENNACLCKDTVNAEWKNNACVCKDEGMEFDDDGNCVKKAAESNDGTGGQNKVSPDNSAKDSAKNDIETLGKWLDTETEKFERSKWRDAEGKFNTARLASDSIAGVVLGTAGGLISSKVIKKKQVENGFEDIKCTIGSQEVADWGDEFQVGIQ